MHSHIGFLDLLQNQGLTWHSRIMMMMMVVVILRVVMFVGGDGGGGGGLSDDYDNCGAVFWW